MLLQAAAAGQAEGPSLSTAAADEQAKGQQPTATATRPQLASCPAETAPPQEPSKSSRQSRRHSTGQGLLPSGRSGAAPATGHAVAGEQEEATTAGQGRFTERHVTFATAGQDAAGQHGRAIPRSPAVTPCGNQQLSKGQRRAEQRQGRASLSSPALGSAGPRQHRRASLGGGGVLPLAGHSFLLTAYTDEKQKKTVTQRITQLGGMVLEDIPKPPVFSDWHPFWCVLACFPFCWARRMHTYTCSPPCCHFPL